MVALIALALTASAHGFSLDEMEADGISLKAGPTDMTEELSIAWVEAALYPKTVEKNREVFIEVRLASPVKSVRLSLDTDKGSLPLLSDDKKSWSRVVKVSPDTIAGLHMARISITGKNDKMISRTLDYVVKDDSAQTASNATLTILSDAQVMDNGETIRQLLPGVKVSALYKAPFYRVKLDDGREGWVEASKVKEPTDDLYLMGFRAYQNREYADAVGYFKQVLQFDSRHPQAHFYLARIYMKQDKTDQAAVEVKEALGVDPENPRLKAMAEVLAARYMDEKKYTKVFELKPELLIAKLNGKVKDKIIIEAKATKKSEAKLIAQAAPPVVPMVDKSIITDSINLVKNSKTGKGSSVYAAVNSVLTMTKSLGTKIVEDGWKVAAASDGIRVIYACRQERGGKLENENFEWKVDQDHRSATPLNENARLLMNRW